MIVRIKSTFAYVPAVIGVVVGLIVIITFAAALPGGRSSL